MKKVRKPAIRRLMGLYVFFTVILASSVLGMPFLNETVSYTVYLIIGVTFWTGFVFSSLFLVLMLIKCRKWKKQEHGDEIPRKKIPGMLRFFKSTKAAIADGVFLASTIAFVVLNFTEYKYTYAMYILLFLMIVSFSLHSILNGNIYNEIKKEKTKGAKKL